MSNLIAKHPELLQIDTFETTIYDTLPGVNIKETIFYKNDFSGLDSLLDSYSSKIDTETLQLLKSSAKTVIYNSPTSYIDTMIVKGGWIMNFTTKSGALEVEFIKEPQPYQKTVRIPQKTIVLKKNNTFLYVFMALVTLYILLTIIIYIKKNLI